MDETINNIQFLKESIHKFKDEIQKFIADPNYANHNAINLRQSIEDLEKNIITKEKHLANQILKNNTSSFKNKNVNSLQNYDSNQTSLPNIYTYAYNTLKYTKKTNIINEFDQLYKLNNNSKINAD